MVAAMVAATAKAAFVVAHCGVSGGRFHHFSYPLLSSLGGAWWPSCGGRFAKQCAWDGFEILSFVRFA